MSHFTALKLTLTLVVALAASTRAATPASSDDETMKDEKMTSSGDEKMTADHPTTRPSARTNARPGSFRPNQGPAVAGPLERLLENADKIGLSDSQKTQLQSLADSTREKARDIFRDANGDRDKARPQMSSLFRDTQEQLRSILSADQQRKFRELMTENGGFRTPNRGQNDEKMTENDEKRSSPAKHSTVLTTPIPATHPVDLNELSLKRIDGRPLVFSALKGKPTVLIFGSYTCPTFRENAKALNDLALRYTAKASFIIVYTKEAHPTGGWEVERNKEAEINLPPHKDEAARMNAAKQARTALALSIPIVIDNMSDDLATNFDTFPDGCVVFDRTGTQVAHEKWTSPRTLRTTLDDLLAPKPATRASAD